MDPIKKIFYTFLLFLSLSACSNTKHILHTGIGQWHIFNRSIPIKDVLKSPHTSSKVKEAILIIQGVKKFAIEELGLEATHNYNTYVPLDTEFVTWVVTASHPIYLRPKKWEFPIIGKIPYIGFFDEDRAKNYLKKLKENEEHYYKIDKKKQPPDVYMRGSSAYSTLGWFSDPLYSSMISKSILDMADLIIHESVHATIFIPSKIAFNERLANFIAIKGGIQYINKKYTPSHKISKDAKISRLKSEVFYSFINEATQLYKKTVEAKAKENFSAAFEKKNIFFKKLPKLYNKIYRGFGLGNAPKKYLDKLGKWNNANLVSYGVYFLNYSSFEALYKNCNKDLKLFIDILKKAYKENKEAFDKNPEEYLKTLHCS